MEEIRSAARPPAVPVNGTPVDIRPLMSGFPTGVAIVTALASDGTPWGMTCTSICSVSLDPPILAVCLRCGSPTLDAVLASRSFAMNLLHDQAQRSAELFASGAPDRFDELAWTAGHCDAGPHLIDSAHTIADCAVADDLVVGDHTVVLGEVSQVHQLRAPRPLLYGMRRYGFWPERPG